MFIPSHPRPSIPVLCCRITLWVYTDNFEMLPRYDIYASLTEVVSYWRLNDPPTGFEQAQAAYSQLASIVNLRDIYFTVQGIKCVPCPRRDAAIRSWLDYCSSCMNQMLTVQPHRHSDLNSFPAAWS